MNVFRFFVITLLISPLIWQTADASALQNGADVTNSKLSAFDWFGDIQPPTQVTPRIWRSGAPTEQSLTALWSKGVRVIIDLENDDQKIASERELAARIGFDFHSYPMDSFFAPDDQKMMEIIEILRRSPEPVLVHCYHGEDRTGVVIGLERVMLENWPASKAYDEMLTKGFHRILLGLDQYFRDKTASL